jgi:hypothetical protein
MTGGTGNAEEFVAAFTEILEEARQHLEPGQDVQAYFRSPGGMIYSVGSVGFKGESAVTIGSSDAEGTPILIVAHVSTVQLFVYPTTDASAV